MMSRVCRVVALLLPLITPLSLVGAQGAPLLEAGASAGGSAFGWQPQVGLAGNLPAASFGWARVSLHGSLARIDGSSTMRSELLGGGSLSTAPGGTGWWIGSDVMRRTGLKDIVEQPRVSTGGWRRIGPVTIGIAASRRSARLMDMIHFARTIVRNEGRLDTISGQWDSIPHVTTVADSARSSAGRLWAETEGTLLWDARHWSAQLAVGGRFASHDVPGGAWAGAELAVRLASPLSLVVGGGTATGSRFALDAEHRYLTLGFRVRPSAWMPQAPARTDPGETIGPLGIDSMAVGRYRLSLWAPRAHSVELSGDFTGWKPVSLTREQGGEWSVALVLMPGAHRLNARVDGGAWIVPSGLTTMSDDFAGLVGILVITGEGVDTRK